MDFDLPFSREEILSGGLQGRRDMRLLALIENRTVYLIAQMQGAIEILFNPEAGTREAFGYHLFYQRYQQQNGEAVQLTIHHLERYAPQWANLIPSDPKTRAGICHRLGQKYSANYEAIPAIRRALGLDTEAVRESYLNRYNAPLETLFTTTTPTGKESLTEDRLVDDIEAKFEWVHLEKGEILFRQGDVGDGLYILVHGRVRVVTGEDSSREIIGEQGPGSIIGEIAIISNEPRTGTVFAIRDSVLLKLSKDNFEHLIQQHPRMLMQISQTLVGYIHNLMGRNSSRPKSVLKTVAVIPVSRDAPIAGFCQRLAAALSNQGAILHLNSARLNDELGAGAAQTDFNDSTVAAWLSEQEMKYRFIIYEVDTTPSAWTARCIRQADQILLVGQAGSDPGLNDIEARMLADNDEWAGVRKRLVLLHPNGNQAPKGTIDWLNKRRVQQYHHIRWNRDADFERLGRFITGRAVGLVLGGGGARGFAHVGVFRAIAELGIEIDAVGGASFGALMAAPYAMEWDYNTIRNRARQLLGGKGITDYTLPFTSVFAGKKITHALKQIFEDNQIEDTWLPCFCVTADLSRAREVVHRRGPIWKYIRASIALPGLFPPIVENGMVLMDGGIINNVPLDVMLDVTDGGPVIGVDVSVERDLGDDYQVGPVLSGWKILWSRLNPFM